METNSGPNIRHWYYANTDIAIAIAMLGLYSWVKANNKTDG